MNQKKLSREDCRALVDQLIFPTSGTADPDEGPSVGIELENFPYRLGADGPESVPLYGPGSTTEALAAGTSNLSGAKCQTKTDENGLEKIYRIDVDGNGFLFEPGGQVEISTRPAKSISALEQHLLAMRSILSSVGEDHGICFGQHGIDPWTGTGKLSNQLCFPRYRALQAYFDAIGPYGQQMMFHTCGLHINLDAGYDEQTRLKRILLANLLSPFATAMFANSPRAGQKPFKSYRSFIWQQTDPLRTGTLPMDNMPERNTLLESYLQFALKAPLIHIPHLGAKVLPREMTMERWLEEPIEDLVPGREDFSYHLTLLFPEVRLKGYIEIRSVDAPPVAWELVPVLFYAGILYSPEHTDKALQRLEGISGELQPLLNRSSFGLEDERLRKTATDLMILAIEGLTKLPKGFVEGGQVELLNSFFTQFTSKGRSFADLDFFT